MRIECGKPKQKYSYDLNDSVNMLSPGEYKRETIPRFVSLIWSLWPYSMSSCTHSQDWDSVCCWCCCQHKSAVDKRVQSTRRSVKWPRTWMEDTARHEHHKCSVDVAYAAAFCAPVRLYCTLIAFSSPRGRRGMLIAMSSASSYVVRSRFRRRQ